MHGVIITIAVPNVARIIEKAKKDAYLKNEDLLERLMITC